MVLLNLSQKKTSLRLTSLGTFPIRHLHRLRSPSFAFVRPVVRFPGPAVGQASNLIAHPQAIGPHEARAAASKAVAGSGQGNERRGTPRERERVRSCFGATKVARMHGITWPIPEASRHGGEGPGSVWHEMDECCPSAILFHCLSRCHLCLLPRSLL